MTPRSRRSVEHRHAADHDDDRHRRAGQRVDDRHHDLGEPGAAQLGVEVVGDLVLEQAQVDRLAPHALDRAHPVNALGERAIEGRAGDPGARKAWRARGIQMIRTTTRIGTTERVSRPSRQSSTSSTTVMPTSSTKSPIAKTEVSRNSCRAWTSPWRRDIRRPTSVLSMNESETRWRWAYIARRRLTSRRSAMRATRVSCTRLAMKLSADHGEEDQRAEGEQPLGRRGRDAFDQRAIDHRAQDQRDRDLARGEHQDGEHRQDQPAPVGADEGPEAPDDAAVEGGEDLLLGVDLRADHGARRPRWHRCWRPRLRGAHGGGLRRRRSAAR